MPKAAIGFNVPPKLWVAFKTQTDELFLSRAPFLDYMVRRGWWRCSDMLRVTIHAGLLAERNDANHLAVLDIAYQKRAALADYLVALTLRQQGELEPAVVANYPRWSGSLWDLTARALTRVLHKSDKLPPIARVDRRCAYATKLCATIQRLTADERGVQLATAEIVQPGKVRGQYRAVFQEDTHQSIPGSALASKARTASAIPSGH